MPQKLSGLKINLGKRSASITSAEFFKWLTQAGRIIVVVTELIALFALLYRFFLDMQIIDLHDEIKQEKAYLKLREKEEDGYRKLQDKLSFINKLPQESYTMVEAYSDVAAKVSEFGLVDTRFTVGKSTIGIEGRSVSVFLFNQYINYLKGLDKVLSINLNNIAQQQGGVRFSLSLELIAEAKQ